MMSNYRRMGCVGVSVLLGLLLVTLLQSGLAWASSAAPSAALSPDLRGLSAARALPPGSPSAASVILTKTVGTDPGECAASQSIALPAGGTATYCYTIRNNGTVTLTTHSLVDNQLGPILSNFPYALVPGASAFLTQSAIITQNTVNSATWSAGAPSLLAPVSASDQATVTVPAPIILTKTVGIDPGVCATANSITLPPGGTAIYCYTIRNSGSVTLTTHNLVDNRLGVLLTDFPYVLVPGATAFLTESALISQTTVNSATWSADGPGVGAAVSASDQATVTVQPLSLILTKTVGLDPGECATTASLELESAGTVTYCYLIRNTGPITLTHHDLVDDPLGPILTNFPYALVPGATAFLTRSAMITQTTINTATWTARSTYTVLSTTASSSARVIFVDKLYLPVLRR